MGSKKPASTSPKKPRRSPRKRPEAPIGLGAGELAGGGPAGAPPAALDELAGRVRDQGGSVLASYREPIGGHWVSIVSLPVERVEPTPFQRDASPAHLEKIARVMEKIGRFLDPIILSPAPDGRWWTPNGNHRLQALKKMNIRAVVGLVVPEPAISHQILALNTEKGYNLREKALGVLKLLRVLSARGSGWADRTEESLAFELEEPAFVTLGLAYEARPRLSGGVYQPVLRRVEAFLPEKLAAALERRAKRAETLLALDDAITAAVNQLKERGMQSPYLKAFVAARVNPIRFHKGEPPPFEETIERMLRAAQRFDAGKVKESDIARSGGPPAAAEE